MMDSDVVVMDDPYKYFKHPLFKDITVLNQAESPENPNGGLLYVQNAAPDGPAAFMFAGIITALLSLPPCVNFRAFKNAPPPPPPPHPLQPRDFSLDPREACVGQLHA